MQQQIAFSLSPEFQTFMAGLTKLDYAQSVIHGIFIDLHPMWKRIVDITTTTGLDERLVFDWDSGHRPILWPLLPNIDSVGPYDPQYVPKVWQRICEQSKKLESPFIVKIYVLPTNPETLPLRRTVEDYARGQPFFTAVIDAPMPILATKIEGGITISATGPGTLGGFLQDQNGNHWGVTCGHVARGVNKAISLPDVSGTPIHNAGTVKFSNFNQLPPQSKSAVCNQYVSPAHPDVDAALFELATPHTALGTVKSLGQVDAVYDRTQLNSGSAVTMHGALSGFNEYEIGGYGVTCKTELAKGIYYCFSHVFDFSAPGNAWSWVPGRIAQALAPRPLQGDSGSWVCFKYSGNQYAYFGNLISVRGATGIATFADALIAWANSDCGVQLKPF